MTIKRIAGVHWACINQKSAIILNQDMVDIRSALTKNLVTRLTTELKSSITQINIRQNSARLISMAKTRNVITESSVRSHTTRKNSQ